MISILIQSSTSITEFFVVAKMSGILVRFVILVGIKALGETTLHFNKDQFCLDLLVNRPWMRGGNTPLPTHKDFHQQAEPF